jgi:peptidyl-Lys metalloendopeptidase
VQFKVVAVKTERMPRMTSGELAREAEKRVKGTREALGPRFNGGTSSQRADTITAHNNAQRFAELAANQLNHANPANKNALYKVWFGAFDHSRYDEVTNHFSDIANMLQQEHVTYDFTGKSPGDRCFPGDAAFTYPGVRTIWLCKKYIEAPQIGTDCKFGTLIHEWTHAVSSTADHAYDESDCQTLATDDPEKAINNADNHEYFAEHLAQS